MDKSKPMSLDLLSLMCRCGGDVTGLVPFAKVRAAVDLYKAHHTGPKCEPTSSLGEPDRSPWLVGHHKRLTPAMVCGSAWWIVAKRHKEQAKAFLQGG